MRDIAVARRKSLPNSEHLDLIENIDGLLGVQRVQRCDNSDVHPIGVSEPSDSLLRCLGLLVIVVLVLVLVVFVVVIGRRHQKLDDIITVRLRRFR